jgi:hypothetical protein
MTKRFCDYMDRLTGTRPMFTNRSKAAGKSVPRPKNAAALRFKAWSQCRWRDLDMPARHLPADSLRNKQDRMVGMLA